MTQQPIRTAAVVVTFNRRELLLQCLDALVSQTLPPTTIIVVDNASTDGSEEAIGAYCTKYPRKFVYLRLEQNIGGAGGFAIGVSKAMELDCDWLWLMDDDAIPLPDALASLHRASPTPENVYASIACRGNELSWSVNLIAAPGELQAADRVDELPSIAEVAFLPFLGFLVHSNLVAAIGVPDSEYFISADDVEYSLRARAAGARLFLVKASRIGHPIARVEYRNILGHRLAYLSLPPWRRYYDTRNRLLVARTHYGIRFWTEAVPGTFARLFLALWLEADRWIQAKAIMAGCLDGICGTRGIRHRYWRLDR
ncbi:glycosyltransferase [Frateuria hangzhouensis]|uniref:glycosyltransferase n=1 Tax=Frateuria hangzhouensis TaxID=2995589 RepID=UPI002260ECE6|nr:glycosyltransferase [Frateuria sp. STR12]MCX7513741.1 glycosyltransferase [Frateuria sp. STR12]